MRIDNGIRFTAHINPLPIHIFEWDFMMIGHKNCHPHFLCISNFFDCSNSIITGQNRIHTAFECFCDQVPIQTVSICNTVRYRHIHLCPASGQCTIQNIGRHYSINIIIADNPYLCFFFYLLIQHLHQKIQILQQMNIWKFLQRSCQKALYLLIPDDFPVSNNPRRHRINMKFISNSFKIGSFIYDHPLFHILPVPIVIPAVARYNRPVPAFLPPEVFSCSPDFVLHAPLLSAYR